VRSARPSPGGALLAAAAATTALNATTYADMLVRGRPPSDLPPRAAAALARRLHVELGDPDEPSGAARREALGALLGLATGLTYGTAVALLGGRRLPFPAAAAVGGLGVMTLTGAAGTVTGLTDPRGWDRSGWLEDLIPHLVFGAVLAAGAGRRRGR
jgi:hypothetical protein